jgi:predicted DNA-binding transcriptional regulator AlpA
MPHIKKKTLAERTVGEAKAPSQPPETATETHPPVPHGSPPLDRIVRKQDLPKYVGLGRTVIAEMITDGKFPKPIKVNDAGRILGWLEIEIIAWQQSRRKLRDEGKNPVPRYQPVPPRPELTKKNTPKRGNQD